MSSSLMPVVIAVVIACVAAVAFYTAEVERERADALAALTAKQGGTGDPEAQFFKADLAARTAPTVS